MHDREDQMPEVIAMGGAWDDVLGQAGPPAGIDDLVVVGVAPYAADALGSAPPVQGARQFAVCGGSRPLVAQPARAAVGLARFDWCEPCRLATGRVWPH